MKCMLGCSVFRMLQSVAKFLLNGALLRGRHRIPRFLFLLGLTCFALMLLKIGVCSSSYGVSLCGGTDLASSDANMKSVS